MNKVKILFLILAIIAVAFVASIGIAISMESITLAIIGIVGATVTMGIGFTIKKKLQSR